MTLQKKSITFEDTADASLLPFMQISETRDEGAIDKSNYSTISSGEGTCFPSGNSTLSSINSYPRDTVVLLHSEHRKFEANIERQNRGRSLKGTICFILTILVLLGMIGLAIASLHHKLSNIDKHLNTSSGLSSTAPTTMLNMGQDILPSTLLNLGKDSLPFNLTNQHLHKGNVTSYQ